MSDKPMMPVWQLSYLRIFRHQNWWILLGHGFVNTLSDLNQTFEPSLPKTHSTLARVCLWWMVSWWEPWRNHL